jgi:hypothetical protein
LPWFYLPADISASYRRANLRAEKEAIMPEMTAEDMLNDAVIGQVLRADGIDPRWFAAFLEVSATRYLSGLGRAFELPAPNEAIVDDVVLPQVCNAQYGCPH